MVSSFLFIFAGMEKIYNYYQDIVTAYTRRADNLKKKIHLLGSIRLLLVAGLIAMVWFFKSEDWKVLAGIAVLFIIPFIALMVWHTKLFARKREAGRLVYATTHRQGYDIKTPGSDPRTGIVHTAPATFLCDRHSASGKQGRPTTYFSIE